VSWADHNENPNQPNPKILAKKMTLKNKTNPAQTQAHAKEKPNPAHVKKTPPSPAQNNRVSFRLTSN